MKRKCFMFVRMRLRVAVKLFLSVKLLKYNSTICEKIGIIFLALLGTSREDLPQGLVAHNAAKEV